MKPLLNTLFVTKPKAYLALDGENILIIEEEQMIGRFPLHLFEQITTFGYTGASPALMRKCAEYNIGLTFMSPSGKFLARVIGKTNGNVLLRKEQYRQSDKEEDSLRISKFFIYGKLYNTRWLLKNMLSYHSLRIDAANVHSVIEELKIRECEVWKATTLEQLRGIEGVGASRYFSVFDSLILSQKKEFYLTERNKRPPLDNMNALLSFLYALLANDVANALEGVGLDSYVGFLHRDRPGRSSLAFDLMEELRPVLVDRLSLAMINRKEITSKGFIKKENGAVLMNDEVRRKVLTIWHDYKEEPLIHPFLKEKIKWGLVPHVQALLLARYLRGDLDGYPPFLWK